MPWFDVTVNATQLIAVEAEDIEIAEAFAFQQAFLNVDCRKDASRPKEISGVALTRLKSLANLVFSEDDEQNDNW